MDGGSSISELGIAGTSAALDNATNTTVLPDYCTVIVPEITEVRFWLVTVFGSTISIISVVENLFLFFLFITRRHHRTTYNMYMMLLAFFDVFVSMAYIFLMSMNVLTDYLQSVPLVRAWFWYMAPMLTISHIAITSSTLIIMAATYERFCITTNSTFLPFVQRYRKRIAAGMILLGVFSKGSIYFEFKIIFNEECQGLMSEISLTFVDWVHDTPYHTVFRFWYRNFATIFVPFFILAYLNIRIVRVFTTHQKKSYCADVADSLEKTKRKATARAATRTLVFVVCTYLISNIINVLLTVWEHIDKTSLDEKYMRYDEPLLSCWGWHDPNGEL
uniref:G_PROTEIN_RECEP_F1_2 domain-containing protein n=1 Tax=Steinernema glaseri TaxID=37863 RepID=A0A1I7ZQU3_9BILA